ncbi:MAG: hypothetical protein WCB93_04140 [Gallionella sp.]
MRIAQCGVSGRLSTGNRGTIEVQRQNLDDFPNVRRWFDAISKRPATIKAYAVAQACSQPTGISQESRESCLGRPPQLSALSTIRPTRNKRIQLDAGRFTAWEEQV